MIDPESLPRILSCGTGPGASSITSSLKNSPEVEHLLSFGREEQDYHMATITRTRPKAGALGELTSDHYYSGALARVLAPGELDRFYQFLFQFVDHLHRRESHYHYRPHGLQTLHEYVNYYHLIADIIASKIQEHRINVALFFNAPHLGHDTICYQVASLMGIPTLVLMQTIFPNKFLSWSHMADCGNFDFSRMPVDVTPYQIEQKEHPSYFYMDPVTNKSLRKSHLGPKDLLLILAYILTKEPTLLIKPGNLLRLLSRAQNIKAKFPRFRDPFARFFHVSQLDYFETLLESEDQSVDFERSFVYFPLHLQPEATTSAMGGAYVDQALAIEHLSLLLPEDCRIYVKENPKQQHFMRDPLFFHRLHRIPSVHIVPSTTCTHKLTDHSQFVATITGTAGWEAISRGKNVVTFGNPWYQSFPGVYPYQPNLSYAELSSQQIVHEDLEKSAGYFLSQLPDGIVYERYKAIVPDFNQKENVSCVVPYIVNVIRGRSSPVFVKKS